MNKKIKVIELITGLERGGAERVVADIARLLPKEKFEVVVISLQKRGPLADEVERSCRVVSLGATALTVPFVFFKLIRILSAEKPDIVHTHLFHADIMGRIAGRLAGIPVVTTLHNVRYGGRWRELLLGKTSFLVSGAVAVSQEVAREAARKGVMPSESTKVVYNGIDMERFSASDQRLPREQLNLSSGEEVLVNVGRMSEQKGHTYLLEAFAAVRTRHTRAKLLLVGGGPLRNQLECQVEELGIQEAVVFLGARDDVPTLLRAADVFIFPSLWEGFALALAEAMACGKIVVSTRVAGVSEIVREGESGFLVESRNADQLAEAIERALLLSPEERGRMEERASAIVRKNFSVQEMVKNYQDFYEEIARTDK